MGLIYATVAMGIMLLFSAAGVMNFAQGSLLALGAYIGWALMYRWNLPSWPVRILLMLLILIAVGAIFCSLCFLPFKRAKWRQAMLICTLGMAVILPEVCMLFITSEQQRMDPIVSGSVSTGAFSLSYQYVIIFVVMISVMLALYILFEKTYCGNILTAASQDKYAADDYYVLHGCRSRRLQRLADRADLSCAHDAEHIPVQSVCQHHHRWLRHAERGDYRRHYRRAFGSLLFLLYDDLSGHHHLRCAFAHAGGQTDGACSESDQRKTESVGDRYAQ